MGKQREKACGAGPEGDGMEESEVHAKGWMLGG